MSSLVTHLFNIFNMKNSKSASKNFTQKKSGFTLIEVLVVIGIIALLATIVIVAINPARQFAQARDTQRVSNLNALLNAVGQRMIDHKGMFRDSTEATCLATMDPTTLASNSMSTVSSSGTGSNGGIDLRPCLVPTYISEFPVDPAVGVGWNGAAYSTGYAVYHDSNGRMHLLSTSTEPSIPRTATQPIEVTR